MRIVERGQIYYVRNDKNHTPIGAEIWADRPALIVSNNTNNTNSHAVEIVYLTTNMKKRMSPTHVKMESGGCTAIAMCEQVHTVDKSRLGDLIDTATDTVMIEIDRALTFSLGINSQNYVGLFKKWENYIKRYHLKVNMEYEKLISRPETETIELLEKQVKILMEERDCYQRLYETKNAQLEELTKVSTHSVSA